MPECPVCHTEYVEGQGICSTCGWNLVVESHYKNIPTAFASQESKDYEKVRIWAQNIWRQRLSKPEPQSEEISRLRAELDESEKMRQKQQSQIEQLTQEREELRERVEQLTQESGELIDELEKARDEELEFQIQQLTQERDELKDDLEESNDKIEELQSQIEKLNQMESQEYDLQALLRERDELLRQTIERVERLESLFDRAGEERSRLQQDSEEVRDRLSKLEGKPQDWENSPPDLQELELIASYNKNPDSLTPNATQVSKAYDNTNRESQSIVLEKSRRGYYWIVTGSDYLVPQPSLKLNQYNYETLEQLFLCRGYRPENDFQLIKPARVAPVSQGQTWELVERGVLLFQPKEEKTTSIDKETLPPPEETETLQNESEAIEWVFEEEFPSIPEPEPIPEDNQLETPPSEFYLSPEEADLVAIYSRNSGLPQRKKREVSPIVEESGGAIALKQDRWGKYWVLAGEERVYLVPKGNIKWNSKDDGTIKVLFDCYGYQPGIKPQLLKPAKVEKNSEKSAWQLVERGALQFE